MENKPLCHVSHIVAIDKRYLCDADLDRLKESITVTQENSYSEDRDFQIYKENDNFIFVPNAFGQRKIRLNDWNQKSYEVTSPILWPRVVLPNGYRPGQDQAIEETTQGLRRMGGGLLDIPTGGGKTLCSLNIAANLGQKALVLVHKEDLATMWQETAEKFFPGARTGHVQQDVWDYKDKHVVTALYQTLHARSDDLPEDFLKQFGFIIVEEGHKVAAPTFVNVVSRFPAKYRLGVSATWERKDGLSCLFHWLLGDRLHKMSVPQLQCKYFLAQIPSAVRDKDFTYRGKLNTARMITHIATMGKLNDYIAKQTISAVNNGRSVMILTDRRKQVDLLRNRLEGLRVCEYVGGATKEEQKKAQNAQVVIGTYQAAGTGTDIPHLSVLILASPRSDIVQAVGRIRRPHPDKKPPIILDPILTGSGYLRALAEKRRQQYIQLGFEEIKHG